MRYIACAQTDKGKSESINEDCIAYFSKIQNENKILLLIVCDGVGGLSYGEVASHCLVHEFRRWFSLLDERIFQNKKWEDQIIEKWNSLLFHANQKLRQVGKRHYSMIGTTLSSLILYKNTYVLFHIGDSRVYKIKHFVRVISKDHTLYEKNKKEFFYGFHNNKEKEKHILTQCVGVTSGLRPYVKVGRVTKNTNFLLCSDGFYQKLKKKEIKMYFSPKHCRRKERIRYALRTCIKLVKEREEMDNISAVVVTCR